ncbi:MAG: PHP domain-containing protein [Candidatus Marinimicrobia bacterium]|nr:PHP domain-containing protein [Candidatus Neomarinimicrobiota bacterium]
MFTHLNVHSTYSKMRGTASPSELIARAKEFCQTHLALTEVNGIWGFIHFVQRAKDECINPIAGSNVIMDNTDEVVLLVENQQGYENLCRLLTEVHYDANGNIARLLERYGEGLFVLAYQERVIERLINVIPKTNLFVELRCGIEERKAQALSMKYKLEMVATGDVYFLNPDDYRSHMILVAIDKNTTGIC